MSNLQHLGRPRVITTGLIGAATIVLALAASQQGTMGAPLLVQVPPTASPPPRASQDRLGTEPWPPFVMVYRETWAKAGSKDIPQMQLIRLEYTDRRHWRDTILENSNEPGAVGSWSELNGLTSKAYDAKLKRDTVRSYAPDEPINAPADWLVPGKMQILERRPDWLQGAAPAAVLATVRNQTNLPNGRRVVEEITYRVDGGIPTLRTETVDGAEVARKEAVEFRLSIPR